MLPSTGYFKEVNCPFYASGLCERPYCHFRHIRKDSNDSSDNFTNEDVILQQLISEAVKKVLLHADSGASDATSASQCSSKQVASEVKPLEILPPPPVKATYNPTPIAELNKLKGTEGESTESALIHSDVSIDVPMPKRHIPVPYTPHRPSKIQVKRSGLEDGEKLTLIDVSNLNKPYTPAQTGTGSGLTYSPNSVKDVNPDPYKPQGQSNVNGTYLPGSSLSKPQLYTPVGLTGKNNSSYIPTNISALQNQTVVSNAYEPSGQTISGVTYEPGGTYVSNHAYSPFNNVMKNEPSLHYEPTSLSKPRYPCFSSDEDEPISKKNKNDDIENGLEDFEVEFDIIGQILEEENVDTILKTVPEKSVRKKTETDRSSKAKSHKKSKKSSIEITSESKRTEKRKKAVEKKHSSHKERSHKESSRESSSSKSDNKGDDGGKVKNKSSHSKHTHSTSKSKHRDKSKDKAPDKNHGTKTPERSSRSSSKHSHSKKSNSESKSKQVDDTSSHKKSKNSSTHTSKPKSKRSNSKSSHKEKQKPLNEDDNQKNLSDDCQIKTDDDFSFDEDILTALSDSEPEDVTEQCLKIFEEYTPTLKQDSNELLGPQKSNDKVELYVGKKRVSHVSDPVKVTKTIAKPDFKVSAAQALADRFTKVREYHISKREIETKEIYNDFQNQTPVTIPTLNHQEPAKVAASKIRIAHVPNVSTMLTAKRTVTNAPSSYVNHSEPSTSTSIHTIAKGTSRTAHIPNEKFIDRPGVLEPLGSKIAANIRSRFLHLMIDECLKIYLAPEDAYARAQIEELTTSKKCTTIAIYRNSAIMAISRLRKELQDAGGVKKGPEESNKISHDKVLVGKLSQVSWSIESKSKKLHDFSDEFRGLKFYNNIAKWILTEQELQDNGFPRPHPSYEKGRAKIYTLNTKQKPPKGNLRTCNRCKKDYTVDKKGKATRKEECIYHPNNKYNFRGESKYQCCSQDGSSEGCASAPCHVFEYIDYENLRGFVRTLPKDDEEDNVDHGVFALDCEMCYTTQGLDLTRVTVIDPKCNVRYETLVRPKYPIIDYNTRYSGITEDQMQNVTTTLLQVQANLLHMFSDKTILVGHSLESDFKALKLIHDTVIDTSVLYPHKMGPPYKRALRNLTSEYLKKIIQNSVEGHDSNEDATVCMELIQFKLKEELKLR